jgi:FKBP-type peptidyl-prolyl cis-trans isomerase
MFALLVAAALSQGIDVTGDGKVTKVITQEASPTAPQARYGQKVSVHYTGKLTDGTKFDSSVDRGTPFEFTIGHGVIEGWSKGVATMKLGEKATFTIGHEYAYGERGFPPRIPARSTLIFEIELLKIY